MTSDDVDDDEPFWVPRAPAAREAAPDAPTHHHADDLLDLVRAAEREATTARPDLLDILRADDGAASTSRPITGLDDPTHDPAAARAETEPAVEGQGWALDGDTPVDLAWAGTDTSLVPPCEMTGIWLTTETGRASPVRMDGQPAEVDDLDITPALRDRLRDFADLWEREWDPAQGWRPRARIGDYEALGRWIARAVKDEVGATDVTLQLAHLGRAGVERVPDAAHREPTTIVLRNQPGVGMPVWGEFVTDAGVGSFSSELNLRLEAWAQDYAFDLDHPGTLDDPAQRAEYLRTARALADEMQAELGPDYRVRLDLPELG